MHTKLISILIACYYSEQTLETVVREIQAVFEGQSAYACQIILVNDGSEDGTYRVASALAEEDSRIVAMDLSKNYGQLCAKMAGLTCVQGDYLVYMDDDGQHPAAAIFDLIKELQKGELDVVYASFEQKRYTGFKRLASRAHGYLMYKSLGKPKHIHVSSFYAINRMMIDALRNYDSPFASPIGYMLQITKRIGNIPIEHRARIASESHYTFRKMVKQSLTVMTSFSAYPLLLARGIGAVTAGLSFLLILICIGVRLAVPSFPFLAYLTLSVNLFLGGAVLSVLGILGDYVGRIYVSISRKPQFYIRSTHTKGQRSRDDAQAQDQAGGRS